MPFLPEFKLSANSDRECGYLYVEDISVYPISAVYNRDDLGIILFWSTDALVSMEGYDNSNSESWRIPVENMKTYHIKAYVVDVYDPAGTYNAGTQYKIVYQDEGNYMGFYMQTGTVITEPPDPRSTQWQKLVIGDTNPLGGTIDDADDLYALFEYSIVTNSRLHGWTTIYETTRCTLYYLEKRGCHNWKITDNSGSEITVSTVRLRTYDNILLDDELEFSSTELDIDLSEYENGDDGVYVVEIWGTEGSETEPELKASVVIYDLCDAEECYKELFRFVICKCSDPCDNTDCEEQYDIPEKRYDMNMVWGLYKMIERYIFLDKFKYMGILSIDDQREQFITRVGQMVAKLKIVTERCGNCTEDSNNDITC